MRSQIKKTLIPPFRSIISSFLSLLPMTESRFLVDHFPYRILMLTWLDLSEKNHMPETGHRQGHWLRLVPTQRTLMPAPLVSLLNSLRRPQYHVANGNITERGVRSCNNASSFIPIHVHRATDCRIRAPVLCRAFAIGRHMGFGGNTWLGTGGLVVFYLVNEPMSTG